MKEIIIQTRNLLHFQDAIHFAHEHKLEYQRMPIINVNFPYVIKMQYDEKQKDVILKDLNNFYNQLYR